MKRSEINEILHHGADFIRAHGFALPPFANWAPARMLASAAAPLRAYGLGWDVTDYGQGRFDQLGLLLFTLRNGALGDVASLPYAEKIMISREAQLSPMHRHMLKVEDIINRGGARLVIELFGAAPDGAIDRSAGGVVGLDGAPHRFAPGERLVLEPGQSVTLRPGTWHAFWGEGGDVLIGEVSSVNDDRSDNWFEQDLPRFSEIEEDAPPSHLLVSDYPT